MRINLPLFATSLFISLSSFSYETDQYSTADSQLRDSDKVFDFLVNSALDEEVASFSGDSPETLAYSLGQRFSQRQLEFWVYKNKSVEAVFPSSQNIYIAASWWNAPVISAKGLASTISISGVQLGADKLSHFFGVGALYLKKYLEAGGGEAGVKRAIDFGKSTEHWYWGAATTGVYSNADLVANYEGLRFYLRLLPIESPFGDSPLIDWSSGKPRRVAEFHFSDFVNDFWSEAKNPNSLRPLLYPGVEMALMQMCDSPLYLKHPERFESEYEIELLERYKKIGFWPNRAQLLLKNVCARYEKLSDVKKQQNFESYSKTLLAYLKKPSKKILSLSSTIDEILSANTKLSFCKFEIESAVREHSDIVSWWATNKYQIYSYLLYKISKNGLGEENRVCQRVEVPNSALKPRNVKLEVEACIKLDWLSGKMAFSHKYFSTVTDDLFNRLERVDPIFGNVVNGKISVESTDSAYYPFNHAVGYVYRTIQPLCRWY